MGIVDAVSGLILCGRSRTPMLEDANQHISAVSNLDIKVRAPSGLLHGRPNLNPSAFTVPGVFSMLSRLDL